MPSPDTQPPLTHPDKLLWPGVTKADLAAYWQAVAKVALPGIAKRPLAIVRCPNGIDGPRFFQKHAHSALPAAIRSGTLLGQPYLAIDDEQGLLAMTQIAAIELHGWQATERNPEHPDRLVFDLDPGDDLPFGRVVEAAHIVRDHLAHVGLSSFCRTTGGHGLHVVAPLSGAAGWDAVRDFSHATAEALTQAHPALFVEISRKEARLGHVFVDWLRNGPGATAIESYSPRARLGAPVAMPLRWEDVTSGLKPHVWTMLTVPERVASDPKPWDGYSAIRQDIPES
ncbi:non-homologous end-joining DNA ligase [Acetobacter conturbans]|uniref:DNA ligase D polymerase domain-containing protein n=1 Tax=Acetobacter conturbans TaxID=1737472 RepID=A0ABX0K0Y2_9PROT|nr:non-homologous end-joining DNA ligase [Acetobacter conturbans]NHN87682.1 hypothetical protein [Acetobacter conturbans]